MFLRHGKGLGTPATQVDTVPRTIQALTLSMLDHDQEILTWTWFRKCRGMHVPASLILDDQQGRLVSITP